MRKLPKPVPRDQIDTLISQASKQRNAARNIAILNLLHRAGLRVSEVCTLLTSQVHLPERMVEIRSGKYGRDRMIPIDDTLYQAVANYLITLDDPPILFAGGITPRGIQKFMERLCVNAKLPRIHPHQLRHSYATELMTEGYNLREVQTLLGHSSVTTTSIYTHVALPELKSKILRRK